MKDLLSMIPEYKPDVELVEKYLVPHRVHSATTPIHIAANLEASMQVQGELEALKEHHKGLFKGVEKHWGKPGKINERLINLYEEIKKECECKEYKGLKSVSNIFLIFLIIKQGDNLEELNDGQKSFRQFWTEIEKFSSYFNGMKSVDRIDSIKVSLNGEAVASDYYTIKSESTNGFVGPIDISQWPDGQYSAEIKMV